MNQIFDYLVDGALTLLVSTPVYIFIRMLIIKRTKRKNSPAREALLAAFWLFICWLASETLLPEFSLVADAAGRIRLQFNELYHLSAQERLRTGFMINLTPFETIERYTSFRDFGASTVNLIGNVLMFVPLGFLPVLLWDKLRHVWKITLIGVLCSCVIECTQLFIDRSVDVDDVLLNTAGVLLGYLLVRILFCVFPRTRRYGLLHEKI